MSSKPCPHCGSLIPDSNPEVCPSCQMTQRVIPDNPSEWKQQREQTCAYLEESLPTEPPSANTDGIPHKTITNDVTEDNAETIEPSSATRFPFQFGDYEVESEIARGGMGVVFKARQLSLNRPVALKMVLSARIASREDVQRFQTEAEAAAKLDHPAIVPVYEVGEQNGQHYFSMGLVEGGSFTELAKDGPIASRRAAELVREVARAVHYAHTRNVVHRDLKPANVLLDLQGHPKVTDFGLAKKVDEDSGLTATGQVMGTPSYMPPEQAEGKMDEVGPLADVYSLGALLYFLLTGRPPFQGNSLVETLRMVVQEDVSSPQRINQRVDVDLGTICTKCLQKNPQHRYASAAALADELNRWLNGQPILAVPITPPERLLKWIRRKPVLAGLWSVAAVFLITLSVGGPLVAVHMSGLYRAAEVAREDEKQAKEKANTTAEELDVKLYYARIGNAQTLIERGDPHSAFQVLSDFIPKKGQKDHRGWAWCYLMCRVRDFDPDTTLEAEPLPPKWGGRYQFSPDAKMLAVPGANGNEGSITIWDLDSAEIIRVLNLSRNALRSYSCFAWSPNGHEVAYPGKATEIHILDVKTGVVHRKLAGHTSRITFIAWSPDGSRIVSIPENGHLRIWDPNSDDAPELAKLPWSKSNAQPIWNPKSNCFVTHRDNVFTIVSRDGEFLSKDGPTSRFGPFPFSWNPDGTSVLAIFDGDDPFVGVWSPWETDAEPLVPLTSTRNVYRAGCWICNGREIATAGRQIGRIEFWDPRTGAKTRPDITVHNKGGASIESVNEKLLSADSNGNIRLWSVDQKQVIPIQRFEHGHGLMWSNLGPKANVIISATNAPRINVARLSQPATSHERVFRIEGDVGSLSWSPNDKLLAAGPLQASYHEDPMKGHIWDLETGQERFSIQAGQPVAWSTSGIELASGINLALSRTWNLNGHPNRAMHRNVADPIMEGIKPARNAIAISWSPDDKLLAIGNHLDGLVLWNTRQQTVERTLPGSGMVRSHCHRWSPDGSKLAAEMSVRGGEFDELYLYDARDFSVIWQLQHDHEAVKDLAWNHDGTMLALGLSNSEIDVLDADSGQTVSTYLGHTESVNSIDWSPDGKSMVSGSSDGTIRVWKTGLLEESFILPSHGLKPIKVVRWSHDGAQIASAGLDRTVRIWDARDYYLNMARP